MAQHCQELNWGALVRIQSSPQNWKGQPIHVVVGLKSCEVSTGGRYEPRKTVILNICCYIHCGIVTLVLKGEGMHLSPYVPQRGNGDVLRDSNTRNYDRMTNISLCLAVLRSRRPLLFVNKPPRMSTNLPDSQPPQVSGIPIPSRTTIDVSEQQNIVGPTRDVGPHHNCATRCGID